MNDAWRSTSSVAAGGNEEATISRLVGKIDASFVNCTADAVQSLNISAGAPQPKMVVAASEMLGMKAPPLRHDQA